MEDPLEWEALDDAEDGLDVLGMPWGDDSLAAVLAEEVHEGTLDSHDDFPDVAQGLRGALHEDYADATDDEMEEALANVLEAMTPAESFNFTKALRQVEKGAAQAFEDPALGQLVTTGLPLAGAAVGTSVGGPGVGTAIGSTLGREAAKALSGDRSGRTPAPPSISGKPAVATELPAAAKAFLLTQHPAALTSLLATALGEHGRKSVDGVPVGAALNLLSTMFSQAAAEADELTRTSGETPAYLLDGEGGPHTDPAAPAERAEALYETLLDAENEALLDLLSES